MASLSLFPKYCVVSTVAPEVSPNRNRVMIYRTYPARDAPKSASSPTAPSMITSAAVTLTLNQILKCMGTTRVMTAR